MKSKTSLAVAAALGLLVLTAAPLTHARNQDDDWVQRSDWSTLPIPDKPTNDVRSVTPRYDGARSAAEPAQSEWVMRQLQITDGYAPVYDGQEEKSAVAFRPRREPTAEERAQSEWLTRQLQISDGYLPPENSFAETRTVASEPASPAERAQSEWLTQQLQVTDGYAPSPVAGAKSEAATMTSSYREGGSAHN